MNIKDLSLILIVAMAAALAIEMVYYIIIYASLIRQNKKAKKNKIAYNNELPPLSVIITAGDARENLKRTLEAVLEQDYPKFEVIVVDNGKNDTSAELITILQHKYENLHHSFIPSSSRNVSRKKLATNIGIKASHYEHLVFTEAGCKPASNKWLRSIGENFVDGKDIVIGYSSYEKGKKIGNRIIDFYNIFHNMRFLGLAAIGCPYMAIGRNMAFRKELYFENKGYSSNLKLDLGWDDILINQIARGKNTRVECRKESTMRMLPPESMHYWREEQLGRLSTAKQFSGLKRYALGFETLSKIVFLASSIALTTISYQEKDYMIMGVAIAAILIRLIMVTSVINMTSKTLGDKQRFYLSMPLFDIVQPLRSLCVKIRYKFTDKREFERRRI